MPLSPSDLAGCLLEVGAVRLQPMAPFTWASGLKSPIYCDNRQLLGVVAVREDIVQALADRSAALKPTLITGMGRRVEGPLAQGHRAVLIEDLISTGMSSLACAEALRAEGAEVLVVLALFSYGLPQAESAFAAAGIDLAVLSSFEVLAREAEARGILDGEGSAALKAWRSDTVAWSRARGGA
jgi:orotate phosphoribosyltransferase